MEFNYDTNNLIIFHYPVFTGGNVIKNSLGLSDNVVFQKQSLAQAQIDGTLSFDDKKEYILSHMKDEDLKKGGWGDLDLGCSHLFMVGRDSALVSYDETSQDDPMPSIFEGKQHCEINDTVRFLSSERNDNLLFSLNWHFNELTSKNFPNAKIITFINNVRMINHRRSLMSRTYNPSSSVSWDEGSLNEREPDFTWDTEWLYDVTATMNGIEELYNLFNLDGWEQAKPFVKEYYHLWCEKNHI